MEINVVLAMSAYDNIKPATVIDLWNLRESGYVCGLGMDVGTLLPMTRNHLVLNIFRQNKDKPWTHIFFLDADMKGISPEILEELLVADADVISPIMTRRKPPFDICLGLKKGAEVQEIADLIPIFNKPQNERPVIDVAFTGLACTLVKREVLEKLDFPFFTTDALSRPNFDQEVIDYYDQKIRKKESMFQMINAELQQTFLEGVNLGRKHNRGMGPSGEDINFCRKVIQAGFSVKCHTGLYINHIGETGFGVADTIAFWKDPGLHSRLEQLTYTWSKDG